MSQKKPTTNQQLEEMRAMIANLEPGKVVTLDRELQERNTTLMLMLYGATAKYGIGMEGDNGILVTAQVPVLQVPANHSLQWEVSVDGKSVMLYIALNETKSAEESTTNAPADVGDTAVGEVGATEETPPPTPTFEDIPVGAVAKLGDGNVVPKPAPAPTISRMKNDRRGTVPGPIPEDDEDMATHKLSDLIGDEFEDEIEVGLGD